MGVGGVQLKPTNDLPLPQDILQNMDPYYYYYYLYIYIARYLI